MSEGEKLAKFSHMVRRSTIKRLANVPVGYENWRKSPYSASFAEMAEHLVRLDDWLFQCIDGQFPSRPSVRAGRFAVADRAEYETLLHKMKQNQTRRQGLMSALTDRVLSMPVYMADRDMVLPLQTLVVADYLQQEIRQWDRLSASHSALAAEPAYIPA